MSTTPSDDELLSRRLDGALQVEDAERLGQRLRLDPRLLEIYLDLIELDTLLAWELAGAPVTLDRFTPTARKHWFAVWIVAACGLMVAASAAWILRPASHRVIVDAPQAPKTVTEPVPPLEPPQIGTLAEIDGQGTAALGHGTLIAIGQRLRAGDQITLSDRAFATLQFDHGVQLLVEGPTLLDLRDRERVTLLHGRVLGTVSPEARGFAVDFPGGVVRDLGTQFAVASSESRAAEVKLLSGVVELQAEGKQASAPPTRLSGSGTVRLTEMGTFAPVDDSSTWLDSIVAFKEGIARIEGSIRFLHGDPPDPGYRRSGEPRVDVFLERAAAEVSAPINVLSGSEPGSRIQLPLGLYDCYLLRFAQVQTRDRQTAIATGSIVFRSPVAGWIVDSNDLASSDSFVASLERRDAWQSQSASDRKNRGWEPGDVIGVQPDGRTLGFTLNTAAAIDEVRVFVRAQPKGGKSE